MRSMGPLPEFHSSSPVAHEAILQGFMRPLLPRNCLLLVGAWVLATSAACASPAPPVSAEADGNRIEIRNDRVMARFEPSPNGIIQSFHARNPAGDWDLVVESFHPAAPLPAGANQLFDVKVSDHRYLANSLVTDAELSSQTPAEAVVKLAGTAGGVSVTQLIRLRQGEHWFHTEVRAELPGSPASLEFLLSTFTFNLNRPPTFVHTPTLKFEGRWPGGDDIQVIGDRCFHSPAVILQEGGLFSAIVPDLETLNARRVVSPDARRTMLVPRNQYSVPVEPDKYTMPSALDLDVISGITERPLMSFGLIDYIVQHHVRYLHPHDGSMTRSLEKGSVSYAFDLFVGATTPENLGYQSISKHLWKRFGQPTFINRRHLAMPFDAYVKTIGEVIFKPMAVQPGLDGYRDDGAFLNFALDGTAVGGFRNAAPFWLDLLGNTEFWNNVRDAIGMHEWGRRLEDPLLIDRARRIIELALAAPRNPQGLFPLIYRAEAKAWQLDSYDASRGGNRFITSGHDSATYNIVAMSKTCAHLLAYHATCEASPRILEYVRNYANWLVTQVADDGSLPSYVGADMEPCETLRHSAQPATSLWFLAGLHQATGDTAYLTAAEKIASYLRREILPRQLWIDLEQYFSCGAKPLDFAGDTRQAQPARGNLSTAWAAEGFAALYRATGSEDHLRAGEQALDYLAFTQCGWDPHFIYTAYPFGGFAVDNSDTAAMLDARQCEYAALFAWYGRTLGRQDLLERGVAAARSSVVLINHPRHLSNGIYRHPNLYPLGLGPENIDHEGHPQSAMRTSPSWGEGSGIFTGLAGILRELEGAYVDVARGLAVGVDGIDVVRVQLTDRILHLDMTGRLSRLDQAWETEYEATLLLTGLPVDEEIMLSLNDAAPLALPAGSAYLVPLAVHPDGHIAIASNVALKPIQHPR